MLDRSMAVPVALVGWSLWVMIGSTLIAALGFVFGTFEPWLLRLLLGIAVLVGPCFVYHKQRMRILAMEEKLAKGGKIHIRPTQPLSVRATSVTGVYQVDMNGLEIDNPSQRRTYIEIDLLCIQHESNPEATCDPRTLDGYQKLEVEAIPDKLYRTSITWALPIPQHMYLLLAEKKCFARVLLRDVRDDDIPFVECHVPGKTMI